MYYKDEPEVERVCGGDWDCPDALHTDQLVRDISNLKKGIAITRPFYDFAVSKRDPARAEKVKVPSDGKQVVVIVEGLMLLYSEELRETLDIRVFVDCDEDIRFMRRLSRDTDPQGGRGRSAVSVFSAWADIVKPAHHRYVEPTKRFAHLIIPSHKLYVNPQHLDVRRTTSGSGFLLPAVMTPELTPSVELEDQEELWPALFLLQAFVAQSAVRKQSGDLDALDAFHLPASSS